MKKSNIRDVTCGVPQGSILVPLLLTPYIKDFFSGVSNKLFYLVLFANVTNLLLSGKDMNILIDAIQLEFSKLCLVTY